MWYNPLGFSLGVSTFRDQETRSVAKGEGGIYSRVGEGIPRPPGERFGRVRLSALLKAEIGEPVMTPRGPTQALSRSPQELSANGTEAAAKNLVLNFFPVTFSASNVQVWVGPWKDTEIADALRSSVPGLVTWRDPADASRMCAWHPTSLLAEAGDLSRVTVAFDESPQLFQRLLIDAVARRLSEIGFTRKGYGWVNFGKPSLLAQVPALAAAASEPIGIYPKIVTEAFFTKNAGNLLVMGLVVDVLYATRLDVTADEWAAAGLSAELQGKYVVLAAKSDEGARFPGLVGKVVGCIDGIRGDRCVLRDPREPALVEVGLAAVAPEPTRWNLNAYLGARYKAAYQAGENALSAKLQGLVRPVERHRLASVLVRERLQPKAQGSDGLAVLPGVIAQFGEMIKTCPETFCVDRLVDPTYSFDGAGDKFATRVDAGLQKYGPYDAQQMRGKAFRILVVAPVEHEGQVRLGVQKLLGGVPTNEHVFTGLRPMYRLDHLQVSYAFAKSTGTSAMTRYAEAMSEAVRQAPNPPTGEPRFHLVLVVIRQDHRDLPDSENPYFQTKAHALVVEGIPTQAITIEKLRQRDEALQYILNTMGVACYGKLGGTSHVLRLPEQDPQSPTELVFGVGRSVQRAGRFSKTEETVGFATVFRANGEYLYNDCTPYCDAAAYERAFEDTIRRTVERVAAFEMLTDGAPLRLVFHVPRRAGQREQAAIVNAIGKLPRFRIDYALVHVNDDHPFHVFDLDNTKPRSRGKPKPVAALLPPRGLSIALGPRERLVTFVGVDQYKGKGLPAPLRITLDRRSTFKDIDYLSQQIFLMSFMNAGSLTPGVGPVTIAYAEKLAQLTGHLRSVSQWTVELIQQKLGRRLWFI